MNNIFVLNKNYKKIGTLSNQGANPQAPYYNDLYVQELDTGADTYQFSTLSSKYTQDLLEIGNHIMFAYKNRNELFTITSMEYSHNEGYKTIGIYAEGLSFELLEVFMERPKSNSSNSRVVNDSDGDGDDNTDDEYADPDDVYIDENGNIIYDKDGGNNPSKEDVTIDGDGNIIYKRSKNNEKNDSLEFKNISYPTFLNVVLKNSGWNYVCQPGLESVKHDISVKYDRNIYAVLQDSMQSYRGVELEFVYEYNNGSVTKTVRAYKDGGRGSFIGKRFEYGVNVRGITKTQEVTDSEDDTILYIDDVGIDITYDVDFALKSAEVPEIEIGDTHYVIDKDFYPPMTITARIGKIEVSFSDPTRNKIYLANNKKIKGSAIEDELDEDNIKDIIDDHDDNTNTPNHSHYELVSANNSGNTVGFYGTSFSPSNPDTSLGSPSYSWNSFYVSSIFGNFIKAETGIRSTSIDTDDILVRDVIRFADGTTISSSGWGKEDSEDPEDPGNGNILSLICAEEIRVEREDGTAGQLDVFGKLYVTEEIKCELTTETNTLKVNTIEFSDGSTMITAGSSSSGSGNTPSSGNYATVEYVDGQINGFVASIENNYLSKTEAMSDYATIEYVDSKLSTDGTNPGSGGSNTFDTIRVDYIWCANEDTGAIHMQDELVLHNGFELHGDLEVEDGIIYANEVRALKFVNLDGSEITPGGSSGSGSTDNITASKITIGTPTDSKASKCSLAVKGNALIEGTLYIEGYYYVNGTEYSDKSLKENIRYIDAPTTYSNDELLEKADLHDFIVNQVNICEYNFIDDDRDKIGFIANDYEGTKVGDKIIFRNEDTNLLGYDSNNLLFATIGALQEEVRIRDEKIATLENRLAAIEKLLGINNDN